MQWTSDYACFTCRLQDALNNCDRNYVAVVTDSQVSLNKILVFFCRSSILLLEFSGLYTFTGQQDNI